MAPARSDALLEARLINIAQRHEVCVALVLEIAYVLAANQTVPDEADLYAVVCAQQPSISECAECGGAERGAPRGIR